MSHFTLEDRILIQSSLDKSLSLIEIASSTSKSSSSVSREIRRHLWIRPRDQYHVSKNECIHRYTCSKSFLCTPQCRFHRGQCRFCGNCNSLSKCPDFVQEVCPSLLRYPYCCNGCSKSKTCTLEQRYYKASIADKQYKVQWVEIRKGFNITEEQLQYLNHELGILVTKQKQSIHHACLVLQDSLPCDERTIYNLIDANLLPDVKNIDLPRKCRLKPRKGKPNEHKIDRACRVNRTYSDYETFIKEYDVLVVEMDTVEGKKGGKCIITFLFKSCNLQLYYLVNDHTARSVIELVNYLANEILGPDLFSKLFEVILTDNGTEFSNPTALEFDSQGSRRTHLFYCDPHSPYQKGTCENNHEMIRKFLPKGSSFDSLTQQQLNIISSHINSYKRRKLNNQSPIELFSHAYGQDTLSKLGLTLIPAEQVTLDLSVIR